MGLTREQWVEKRVNELSGYVEKYGRKVKDVMYWDTYPICVQDICVDGVAVFNGEVVFADYYDGKFKVRKEAKKTGRKFLEDVMADMKQLDKNKK